MTTEVTESLPLDFYTDGANIMKHLIQVEATLADRGINAKLHHLILLRVSQINGCGYCVKMHTADARRAGESNERLDHLAAWRHADEYSAAEKVAFAWAEALTQLHPAIDNAQLRAALREHYDEHQIATLTAMVGMINFWNRIQMANY